MLIRIIIDDLGLRVRFIRKAGMDVGFDDLCKKYYSAGDGGSLFIRLQFTTLL